jgi:hypothetical protein
MKHIFFISALSLLVSCGKQAQDGKDGRDGATVFGINGTSTGIDFEDIDPGLACASGGVSIFTFSDLNSDGRFDTNESILKVKAICHGTNGTNGIDGVDGIDGTNGTDGVNGQNASITLESVISSTKCPSGGVKISSSTSSPVEVCNGVNGLNGEQGIPGIQGLPGMPGANGTNGIDGINGTDGTNGTNGTVVTPVKFCTNDNSTFPEYGLLIGSDLFAVYWGTTPASPNTPQAFLTKLVAGNYKSTGGNNCLFSIL